MLVMSTKELISKIEALPPEFLAEVELFVDFLHYKWSREKGNKTLEKRQFGYAKGMFTMSDDFDEPLDDFKDYM